MIEDSIYSNSQKLIEVSKELAKKQKELDLLKEIDVQFKNIKNDINMLDGLLEEEKLEYENIISAELTSLCEKTNSLYLDTLLNKKYDNLNALVMLHSGAGGTESYDFVEMLFRMYTKYCEKENLKLVVNDYLKEDVGYKSLSFTISGENAYGKMKSEKGVHRLVRISPFDSNKRRHTTFASVEVIPEIINDEEVNINPQDLKIDTFRSSGAGGQHINKTESAVRITHLPTNIVVSCQNERSQIQNKETCLKILKSKLLLIKEQQHLNEISEISGEQQKIEWGNQIRSYIFCPYTLVKDHRTNYETSDVDAVMNGELEDFVLSYLINCQN